MANDQTKTVQGRQPDRHAEQPAGKEAGEAQAAETRAPQATAGPTILQVSAPGLSPAQLRLECLKIALSRGFAIGTADGLLGLKRQVDIYHAIVADEPEMIQALIGPATAA